jgi:sodium transport system permease protein
LLLIALIVFQSQSRAEQFDRPLELPIVGAERAPNLVAFLEQQNVTVQPPPADPEAAVRAGDADVILVIPEDYAEDFRAGRPAMVQLVADTSRQVTAVSIERTRNTLEAYSRQIGVLRLQARGVSPSVTEALALETVDVATPQARAGFLLGLLPAYIIFAVFISGLYIATDTTAGERERGSLEPLIINPLSSMELVLGKLGAVLLFSLAGATATILGFALALTLVPIENFIGIRVTFEPLALLTVLLLTIPVALFAAILQMALATFTKSVREAQSYLSFLMLIPFLPGLFLGFAPVRPDLNLMLIPTFGQQLLFNQVLRGEPLDLLHVLTATLVTTALALVLAFLTARLYQREAVLLGR